MCRDLQLRGRCRGGRESDELIITGNVADGSEIGVVLNPVEQLKGTVEIRPIDIGGTNGADVIKVAGVTGIYAESLIGSEAHYDAATGDIVINATFGMGHLATAVTAATTMTQNWWLQSVGSYERRNPITLGRVTASRSGPRPSLTSQQCSQGTICRMSASTSICSAPNSA